MNNEINKLKDKSKVFDCNEINYINQIKLKIFIINLLINNNYEFNIKKIFFNYISE